MFYSNEHEPIYVHGKFQALEFYYFCVLISVAGSMVYAVAKV